MPMEANQTFSIVADDRESAGAVLATSRLFGDGALYVAMRGYRRVPYPTLTGTKVMVSLPKMSITLTATV